MDDYSVTELSELIPRGAPGSSEYVRREAGNVFRRPDGSYGILYAGAEVDNGDASVSHVQVHLATSPNLVDGGTWTRQGIVLPFATLGYYTEDPYVITYGGFLWCFVEKRLSAAQHDIVLLRSGDGGFTWTQIADPILGDSTDTTSFDRTDTSSPVVWQEGSRLYMLYEGRAVGDDGKVGLAWSDTGPDGSWTKYNLGTNQADPIIDRVASTWYANSLVPDDLVRRDGTYYLIAHGNGGSGYRCGVFEATAPSGPWTDPVGIPITTTSFTTIMVADHPSGLEMIGINEASGDPDYMGIKRFTGWGELARGIMVGSQPVAHVNLDGSEVGEVYVGDTRVFGRTLADTSSFLSANFNTTAGTTLESVTPEIGTSLVRHTTTTISGVVSDVGRARSGTGTVIYYSSDNPPSADYTVECDVAVVTKTGTDTGPAGRIDTAAATYYTVRANITTNAFELQSVVAGTATVIGSWAVPGGILAATTYRVALHMAGDQISVDVDGTQRIAPVTSSTVTAAGKAGMRLTGGATNTTRVHIDNLLAYA